MFKILLSLLLLSCGNKEAGSNSQTRRVSVPDAVSINANVEMYVVDQQGDKHQIKLEENADDLSTYNFKDVQSIEVSGYTGKCQIMSSPVEKKGDAFSIKSEGKKEKLLRDLKGQQTPILNGTIIKRALPGWVYNVKLLDLKDNKGNVSSINIVIHKEVNTLPELIIRLNGEKVDNNIVKEKNVVFSLTDKGDYTLTIDNKTSGYNVYKGPPIFIDDTLNLDMDQMLFKGSEKGPAFSGEYEFKLNHNCCQDYVTTFTLDYGVVEEAIAQFTLKYGGEEIKLGDKRVKDNLLHVKKKELFTPSFEGGFKKIKIELRSGQLSDDFLYTKEYNQGTELTQFNATNLYNGPMYIDVTVTKLDNAKINYKGVMLVEANDILPDSLVYQTDGAMAPVEQKINERYARIGFIQNINKVEGFGYNSINKIVNFETLNVDAANQVEKYYRIRSVGKFSIEGLVTFPITIQYDDEQAYYRLDLTHRVNLKSYIGDDDQLPIPNVGIYYGNSLNKASVKDVFKGVRGEDKYNVFVVNHAEYAHDTQLFVSGDGINYEISPVFVAGTDVTDAYSPLPYEIIDSMELGSQIIYIKLSCEGVDSKVIEREINVLPNPIDSVNITIDGENHLSEVSDYAKEIKITLPEEYFSKYGAEIKQAVDGVATNTYVNAFTASTYTIQLDLYKKYNIDISIAAILELAGFTEIAEEAGNDPIRKSSIVGIQKYKISKLARKTIEDAFGEQAPIFTIAGQVHLLGGDAFDVEAPLKIVKRENSKKDINNFDVTINTLYNGGEVSFNDRGELILQEASDNNQISVTVKDIKIGKSLTKSIKFNVMPKANKPEPEPKPKAEEIKLKIVDVWNDHIKGIKLGEREISSWNNKKTPVEVEVGSVITVWQEGALPDGANVTIKPTTLKKVKTTEVVVTLSYNEKSKSEKIFVNVIDSTDIEQAFNDYAQGLEIDDKAVKWGDSVEVEVNSKVNIKANILPKEFTLVTDENFSVGLGADLKDGLILTRTGEFIFHSFIKKDTGITSNKKEIRVKVVDNTDMEKVFNDNVQNIKIGGVEYSQWNNKANPIEISSNIKAEKPADPAGGYLLAFSMDNNHLRSGEDIWKPIQATEDGKVDSFSITIFKESDPKVSITKTIYFQATTNMDQFAQDHVSNLKVSDEEQPTTWNDQAQPLIVKKGGKIKVTLTGMEEIKYNYEVKIGWVLNGDPQKDYASKPAFTPSVVSVDDKDSFVRIIITEKSTKKKVVRTAYFKVEE